MWFASQVDALGDTESDSFRLRRWWSPLLPWVGIGLRQSFSFALSELYTTLGKTEDLRIPRFDKVINPLHNGCDNMILTIRSSK